MLKTCSWFFGYRDQTILIIKQLIITLNYFDNYIMRDYTSHHLLLTAQLVDSFIH